MALQGQGKPFRMLYLQLFFVGILHMEGVSSKVLEAAYLNTSRPPPKQISRSWMLQLLCQVTNTYAVYDVTTSQLLQRRYAIEANDPQFSPLTDVVQLRRLDVIICCKNDSELHIKGCVDHMRRKRIDMLCSRDSTQHLPFTVYRDVFMTERLNRCCYMLGSHRYDCFGEGATHVTADSHMEYSLDETDPINDIWNYQLNTTLLNEALHSSSPEQARQLINKLNALDGDRARQSRHLQERKVEVIAQGKTTLMSALQGDKQNKTKDTLTSVVQPAKKKVRHPGAILESFRRHSDRKGNVTSSKSTFAKMSGSEVRDLISSLQQQWWVQNPETVRKSLMSNGYNLSAINAKVTSEPLKKTSSAEYKTTEQMSFSNITHERTPDEERPRKEAYATSLTMSELLTDKRPAQRDTMDKGRNCTYSLLGYDQMKGQSLHEILKRKFKHEKFGTP